jgi:hypothetical protein
MMPQASTLEPDFSQAERFLAILDETAERFTFQTFDDDKQRKDKRLASVLTGSLEECWKRLVALNRQGAGVFVTVNETDGKGRKLENITRIRAVWHEEDYPCGKEFPIEPHMLIESSPGKHHRYWLVSGLQKDEFAGVMERMIQDYRSDPNVKDIARVLRVPGFFHQKDPAKPFMVRIVQEAGGLDYAADALLAAFPPVAPRAANTPPSPTAEGTNPAAHKALVAELASRAAKRTHEDPTKGRHAMVLWLGRECAQRGIPADWAAYAIKVFASLMRQTDTTGKAVALDVATETKAFVDAHTRGLTDPPEKRFQPKPRPQRAPAAAVIDITDEAQARLEFERQINATDDFDQLAYVIADAVQRAQIRTATRESLLKQISAKTGVSRAALKADGPRQPHEPSSYEPRSEKPADFIAELNDKHAVVPVGGAVRILNREYDPGLKRPLLTFSARTDFITRYENRVTMKGGEEIDIGTYWLKSPQRRQYDGVTFLPGGDVPGYLNLWTGWGVDPDGNAGSCELFRKFVYEVIAGSDGQRFLYIWGWLAHLFQRPQELPETALVLRGEQGTGKNTFVDAIAALVGAHYIQLSSLQQVVGRFQGHLADTLLVFANEAIWGGDKSAEGTLKHMISDAMSAVERKGKDIVPIPNFKRLIAASNEDWVVPRGRGDRRWVVCDVSDHRKGDFAYFEAIRAELADGGLAALMHDLMTADISRFNPRVFPDEVKGAGWDLSLRSANSVQRWWFDALQRGWLYRDSDAYAEESALLWPDRIEADRLQGLYLDWCKRHSIHHPETVEALGKEFARFGLRKVRPRTDSGRLYAYKLPGMDAARETFGGQYGIPAEFWTEGEDE